MADTPDRSQTNPAEEATDGGAPPPDPALQIGLLTRTLLPLGSGPKTVGEVHALHSWLVARWRTDAEKALKYVDDTNTRFLNKARGLITFNGLTLAVFSTLIRLEGGGPHIFDRLLVGFGIGCALLSAVILLWTHFLVNFGPNLEAYKSAAAEFDPYFVHVIRRAKWISIAGFLSFLSLIPLVYATYRWIEAPGEIVQGAPQPGGPPPNGQPSK